MCIVQIYRPPYRYLNHTKLNEYDRIDKFIKFRKEEQFPKYSYQHRNEILLPNYYTRYPAIYIPSKKNPQEEIKNQLQIAADYVDKFCLVWIPYDEFDTFLEDSYLFRRYIVQKYEEMIIVLKYNERKFYVSSFAPDSLDELNLVNSTRDLKTFFYLLENNELKKIPMINIYIQHTITEGCNFLLRSIRVFFDTDLRTLCIAIIGAQLFTIFSISSIIFLIRAPHIEDNTENDENFINSSKSINSSLSPDTTVSVSDSNTTLRRRKVL